MLWTGFESVSPLFQSAPVYSHVEAEFEFNLIIDFIGTTLQSRIYS